MRNTQIEIDAKVQGIFSLGEVELLHYGKCRNVNGNFCLVFFGIVKILMGLLVGCSFCSPDFSVYRLNFEVKSPVMLKSICAILHHFLFIPRYKLKGIEALGL